MQQEEKRQQTQGAAREIPIRYEEQNEVVKHLSRSPREGAASPSWELLQTLGRLLSWLYVKQGLGPDGL